ncbi:MAG: hypothetical protein Q8R53_01255 [Nanoarchaeota archaeon]|nr:hypothetical protein [Nanoarchaeota archaeon]
MKILSGKEQEEADFYLHLAAKIAGSSPCYRSRCGAVIVGKDRLLGEGYNAPPLDERLETCIKDSLPPNFKSDQTCCVHAEQRAIMDALRRNPEGVSGARLYFIRLDDAEEIQKAGKPYCTICSKMALDAGLAEFVLWHEEGITVYETKEYNALSFQAGSAF